MEYLVLSEEAWVEDEKTMKVAYEDVPLPPSTDDGYTGGTFSGRDFLTQNDEYTNNYHFNADGTVTNPDNPSWTTGRYTYDSSKRLIKIFEEGYEDGYYEVYHWNVNTLQLELREVLDGDIFSGETASCNITEGTPTATPDGFIGVSFELDVMTFTNLPIEKLYFKDGAAYLEIAGNINEMPYAVSGNMLVVDEMTYFIWDKNDKTITYESSFEGKVKNNTFKADKRRKVIVPRNGLYLNHSTNDGKVHYLNYSKPSVIVRIGNGSDVSTLAKLSCALYEIIGEEKVAHIMEDGDGYYRFSPLSEGFEFVPGEYRGGTIETCISDITGIYFSNYDTSQISSMLTMFACLGSVRELDLSCFNTSGVTSMERMFAGCTNLQKITLGAGWDMTNLTSWGTSGMFNIRNNNGLPFLANLRTIEAKEVGDATINILKGVLDGYGVTYTFEDGVFSIE